MKHVLPWQCGTARRKVGGSSPSPLAKTLRGGAVRQLACPISKRSGVQIPPARPTGGLAERSIAAVLKTAGGFKSPVRPNRTSSAIFIRTSSHAAACHRQKTRWHRKCRAVPRPCFGYDSFLSDLSEAGLPRMTSTALRWTPKRHHFTRTNTRHTNKTPQTAQRYAVDPLSSVCLTPLSTNKMLKMAI